MATLPESDEYPAGIYQIETTDPVLGGAPNEATLAGLSNVPTQQLAKRTRWLKTRVDQLLGAVVAATTTVAGIVRLSSATNSTSETLAATPAAVKAAMDNADSRALKTTTVTGAGLATGGGGLDANRTINVPKASTVQAQAGTYDETAMTPLKVAQAIAAQVVAATTAVAGIVRLSSATNSTSETMAATPAAVKAAMDNADSRALKTTTLTANGLATGGGSLAANRTIDVPKSSTAQAQAGTDDATAMTPLRVAQAIVAQVIAATTAVAGIVRLSSATTSTSTTLAATPAAVKVAMDNADSRALKTITMTGGGLATGGGSLAANRTIDVPRASTAQAQAGTDDTTAMTPLKVAQAISGQSPANLQQTGWQKMPSGLIIQWGRANLGDQSTVVFPISFPGNCCAVVFGEQNLTGDFGATQVVGYQSTSNTGFVLTMMGLDGAPSSGGFSYVAIGY